MSLSIGQMVSNLEWIRSVLLLADTIKGSRTPQLPRNS
jgi:hypothetical protein